MTLHLVCLFNNSSNIRKRSKTRRICTICSKRCKDCSFIFYRIFYASFYSNHALCVYVCTCRFANRKCNEYLNRIRIDLNSVICILVILIHQIVMLLKCTYHYLLKSVLISRVCSGWQLTVHLQNKSNISQIIILNWYSQKPTRGDINFNLPLKGP